MITIFPLPLLISTKYTNRFLLYIISAINSLSLIHFLHSIVSYCKWSSLLTLVHLATHLSNIGYVLYCSHEYLVLNRGRERKYLVGWRIHHHNSLPIWASACIHLFATVQSIEPRINACSDSPSPGLFLTYRGENVFLMHNMVHKTILYVWCLRVFNIRNNSLTLNGGLLYIAAYLCPCWPHAQSQLPHF